ncbi:Iron-regulated ABC transporter permease protein SufD [Ekhidna lutea]|uniref:Iron-regulated ABC transporter permease protein SufD n=1 Tax=Ekhidna lutea TaxID=447679 RepID=A0A239LZJ6_EKHLU|nr:Fe-S cluster assembly protein SufD [Ekhidna lutea]SNT35871.1 Iron-regulated ABC transporter permease protein SufD [Ekhidna lutea]
MIKDAPAILENIASTFKGNKAQKSALDMLNEVGLPHRKSEAYKFTPITSLLEKNIDFQSIVADVFDADKLYDEAGSHLVFINGELDIEKSTIADALKFEVAEVSEGKHDPFSLLNAAYAKEEIRIESGYEEPVFVYHFNSNGFTNPRIKVNVKDGHTFRIIEKLITPEEQKTFTNSYIDFNVGKNAFGYHTKVQNYNAETFSHETVVAHVSRDGQFYNNTFSFEGAMVRNNLTINLEDENTEGHMYGLFLLDKKSHVDNNTSVDHTKPNSFSNELYKGILDEKSTGVFNGKIYVRQDAQKTNAFQSNNNILLSEDATLHTKPQLEIWADDVKCSHGCTSGQLDEDAIFYLRARGIKEKNAKAMILKAFAIETMQHIKVESVKEEVQQLVDLKLG